MLVCLLSHKKVIHMHFVHKNVYISDDHELQRYGNGINYPILKYQYYSMCVCICCYDQKLLVETEFSCNII